MRRLSLLFLAVTLGASSPALAETANAKTAAKKAPAKTAKQAKPAKPAPKKITPVAADKKKKLATLYAGFKFGMSKDEVVGLLAKELDERYEEKIKTTTDVAAQDRLRKEKKGEVARISSSFIEFKGKKSGWDTSIVEDEFAHTTGEAMLERWENKDGKNQRRFFFFKDGRLYKMFVSLDISFLPEDKKNFETFAGYMKAQYGPGDIDGGTITWTTDEFVVRAVDKLKSYDALGLVIEDPKVVKPLLAERASKAPPKKETNSIIKAVIDTDGNDTPDTKSNGNAVDAVIKAQGGKR